MYRYSGSPDVSDTSNLDAFDDADQISAWAKDAMSWAVANNILLGDNHNKLSPLDGTTRAEMAAMVARLLIPQAH